MSVFESSQRSRRSARWALKGLIVLALGACASSPSFVSSPLPARQPLVQNLPMQPGDVVEVSYYITSQLSAQSYRVAPGDIVSVDVVDHPDLTRERALVVPDGTLSLPTAGSVAAAGRTLQEIAAELSKRYRAALIRNPRVTVALVDCDTLLRALVTRSTEASRGANHYEIANNGMLALPAVTPIDARRPLSELRAAVQQAYLTAFGGRLEVVLNLRQSKPRVVHVIGEVVRPGNVEFQPQINVLTAVASAGGMMSTAQPDRVVLIRYHSDGTQSQWLLDLERAVNRAGHDSAGLSILPGDVIFVPKSGVALANDVVDQFVRRMLPLNIGVGVTVQP